MTEGRSATQVDEILGDRVRARRLEVGVSQERLAELIGVTFQQVQKYESGTNRIAASRLLDIAIALDTEPAAFFEGLYGKRRATPEPALERLLATPGAVEFLRHYAAVGSIQLRRRLLDLVKTIATVR